LERVLPAGRLQEADAITRVIAKALSAFDPKWVVGVDRHEAKISLSAAIRLVARDRGKRAYDTTNQLKKRLGWPGSS
jgi:hypothetical protein